MEYLSNVHIRELEFLVGDSVNLITLGKYEIRFSLWSLWLITVYSRIQYEDNDGKVWVTEAEGPKYPCRFTEVFEKKIERVYFEEPIFLVLQFKDNTRLKISGEAGGYEAFLLNGPDGQLYVFK